MKVDQRVQKALFLFACTNSCMNPIVYGAFNIRVKRAVQVSSRTAPPADTCSSGVQSTSPFSSYTFGKYTHGANHGRTADGDVLCLVRWQRVSGAGLQSREQGAGPAVARCGGVRRRPRGRRFAVPAKCVTCGGEAVLGAVVTTPLPLTTPGTT
ncbi:hypothetical protein B566_EDAN015433 [Ephemera danica]|nr:hypothetical protein B566_EDAN015433 [Ephemera danica]